jgi:hypothetical protein
MNTKTILLVAAGFLALPMMAIPAGADTAKNCAAAWKDLPSSYKVMTSEKMFSASCMESPAQKAAETAKSNKTKLAGDGCHDYSECTNREVVSDPH